MTDDMSPYTRYLASTMDMALRYARKRGSRMSRDVASCSSSALVLAVGNRMVWMASLGLMSWRAGGGARFRVGV